MSERVKKTIDFHGITIKVEWPKGSDRQGVDSKGKPWTRHYHYDYGFIPRTKGGDEEELDVFVGPNPDGPKDDVYWVRQLKEDGSFDEYKVFLGFDTRAEARRAYLQHIPAKFFGGMAAMSLSMMKALLGVDPLTKKAAVGFLFTLGSKL